MNLKSITFRCSSNQNARMAAVLSQTEATRTDFITSALEAFLDFAEQPHIQHLDLFELVEAVDALGGDTGFAEQA